MLDQENDCFKLFCVFIEIMVLIFKQCVMFLHHYAMDSKEMKQLGANYMLKRGPPNTSNNKT